MVKGWARVGWSLGGGSVAGCDDGGNLSSDLGSVVGLTTAIAVANAARLEDIDSVMLKNTECGTSAGGLPCVYLDSGTGAVGTMKRASKY